MPGLEDDGDIYFKQSLANRIIFLYKSYLHIAHASFGRSEGGAEVGIDAQRLAAAVRFVGGSGEPS